MKSNHISTCQSCNCGNKTCHKKAQNTKMWEEILLLNIRNDIIIVKVWIQVPLYRPISLTIPTPLSTLSTST